MGNAPRVIRFTLLAATLAVAAAACGSAASSGGTATGTTGNGGSTTIPASDPLASMSGVAILTKAIADAKTVPAMVMKGTGVSSGKSVTLDFTLEPTACEGTMTLASEGTIKMITTGGNSYVLLDATFWKTMAGGMAGGMMSGLEGKYIKSPSTSTGSLSSLDKQCSTSELTSGAKPGKGATAVKDGRTVFDGVPALKLTVTDPTSGNGYAYVTDTATPLLLQSTETGKNGGTVTVTYPTTPPVITAPPASEVVDGSKYGL